VTVPESIRNPTDATVDADSMAKLAALRRTKIVAAVALGLCAA
jgi:hypothetical protein